MKKWKRRYFDLIEQILDISEEVAAELDAWPVKGPRADEALIEALAPKDQATDDDVANLKDQLISMSAHHDTWDGSITCTRKEIMELINRVLLS